MHEGARVPYQLVGVYETALVVMRVMGEAENNGYPTRLFNRTPCSISNVTYCTTGC